MLDLKDYNDMARTMNGKMRVDKGLFENGVEKGFFFEINGTWKFESDDFGIIDVCVVDSNKADKGD